jgi:hypothetical protein
MTIPVKKKNPITGLWETIDAKAIIDEATEIANPTAAPTLAQSANASSTLPAGTYYVRCTWVNIHGETKSSPNASLALTSGNQLDVTLPTFPSGTTGANVYISTTSGSETKQGNTTTTTYIQSVALVTGSNLPGENTTAHTITPSKIGILKNLTTTEKSNLVGAINEHETQINAHEAQLGSANTQTAIIKRGLQKIYSDQSTPAHLKKLLGRTLINHMGRQGDFVSQFNRWGSNLTIDTATYFFGTSSGKIDNSAGTTTKSSQNNQNQYTSGKYVLIGFWAKGASGTPSIASYYFGYDSAGTRISTDISLTRTIDATRKFYWAKFNLTAKTDAYWQPRLDVISFGTANDVVNFDGMVSIELTSAEFSYAHTQAEIEAKYGYINSVQHTQNPYFIAYGKNLLPPFTEWTLHANTTVIEPYKLELNATASNQESYIDIPIVPSETYTFSALLDGGHMKLHTLDESKTIITAGSANTSGTVTKTTEANAKFIRLVFASSVTGTFTFTNPMLNLGSTALPFEPANNDYGFIEAKLASNLDGTIYDTLYQSGTELRAARRFKLDMVLDGTLAWSYYTDKAGYKVIFTNSLANAQVGTGHLVKYDGKIVQKISDIISVTASDQFEIRAATHIYISLADTDTGWNESVNPTTGEIQAYFYGWKMYTSGTTITDTSTWDGVGTKAWAYKNKDGVWVDGTTTLPTSAPNNASQTPLWSRYSLSYQLANEKDEPVSGEFALNFHSGDNQVEFGEGVIVREVANPSLYSGVYYINIKGNASIPDSPLKNRTSNILTIYKSGQPDKKWTLNIPSSTAYGTVYAKIPEADFDKTKPYYITYLLLDKHEHTVNVVESELSYNTNLSTVVNQLVQDVTDNQGRLSIVENEKANKNQMPWIAPTLLNGWLNYGGAYQTAGYYKNEVNEVKLKGVLKSGSGVMFKLPSNYRPKEDAIFPIITNNGTSEVIGSVYVKSNGDVQFALGSNTYAALSNISFRAEQ